MLVPIRVCPQQCIYVLIYTKEDRYLTTLICAIFRHSIYIEGLRNITTFAVPYVVTSNTEKHVLGITHCNLFTFLLVSRWKHCFLLASISNRNHLFNLKVVEAFETFFFFSFHQLTSVWLSDYLCPHFLVFSTSSSSRHIVRTTTNRTSASCNLKLLILGDFNMWER